jgi:uncharacterized protein YjiS (DUF1127 family)
MTTDFIEHGLDLDRSHASDRADRFTAARLFSRARLAFAEARRRRRERRMLRSLSDRVLRDIGLSDAEINTLRARDPFPTLAPESYGWAVAR